VDPVFERFRLSKAKKQFQAKYLPYFALSFRFIAMDFISNAFNGFIHLFFSKKFGSHRVLGLAFLIQFFAATFLIWYDYNLFIRLIVLFLLEYNV
jgi:hypothetical protein